MTDDENNKNGSFSFGENWLNFIECLGAERYEQAKRSLSDFLRLESLRDRTFLDIGCGSGIFSLAAIELGAKKVISIDVDPKSVEACRQVKTKCAVGHWEITEASILDENFVRKMDKFDIVYSWGVLHHTGDMWQAIDNAAGLVKDKGFLGIAIYNQTRTSNFWLKFKSFYNQSGKFLKHVLVWSILLPRVLIRLLKLKHPLKEKRGMSIYYDAIDWAGGLPYEFATFDKVCSYVGQKGFKLVNSGRTTGIGCNEFVFEKIDK